MRKAAGFTMVEMLVSLVVFLLVIAGVSTYYVAQSRVGLSEQLGISMEANLRLAMDRMMFKLRNAGYGAPTDNFASWMPWVTGFTANPTITAGGSASLPDTISMAACTSTPVASLTAGAAVGATTLTLNSAAALNATNKRLVFINDLELARISSVSGNTITIDTNPLVTGNQGVTRAYAISTPLCRVDVTTYTIDATTMKLMENANDGAGAQAVMDGLTNLKITSVTTGTLPKYQVELTAKSSQVDPSAAGFTYRSLRSSASKRN
jgi:prepilin-type N-terminal cleavage/methylation domain-containing protein